MGIKNVKKFTPIFTFGLILAIFLAYQFAYHDRIYPGIAVANINLGNKTKKEAQLILLKKTQKSPQKLLFTSSNQSWEENLQALGLSYEIEETIERVYRFGRRKNSLSSWQERVTAWRKGINLSLTYKINQPLLEEKVAQIGSALFVPKVEPQIKVSAGEIIIEQGQAGQEVDQQALLEAIKEQLSFLKTGSLPVPVNKIDPQSTEKETQETKIRAEKLLNKSLNFLFENQTFTLDEQELIDFALFGSEKINAYVKNLASTLDRQPQYAAFQFQAGGTNGKVTLFRPAKNGIKIDEEKLSQEILAALEKLESGEENQINLSLPFKESPPKIQTADVNNLGIKELVGKGTSYFRGSIASRIHNIVLASSRLNGLLIAPGETFSFNTALGDISQATGYQEAYIIQGGRTILGDGGGVCQVSTTLFRAALNAGLPIEERHAHAYRVAYYEQNSPVGLDATVFAPRIDFKFKNDTPAYLLIQTSVDTKNQTLVFELYGTSDERTVSLGKSRIWDQISPPPDLYQDDPTLPAGKTKQVDWSAWGAKVAFDWQVKRGGEILQERTFYSVYRPWQAVFLRGTGQ